MPQTTTLTKTPYAILSDAANIETAGKPGFEHLERFVVARFPSVSARNAAFASVPPEPGQLIYVHSEGAFQTWNGSAWVEFGDYSRTRTKFAKCTQMATTQGSAFVNIPGMAIAVEAGLWQFFCLINYRTNENTGTDFAVNFTFPGSTSTASMMTVGVGTDNEAPHTRATTVNIEHDGGRTSGNFDAFIYSGHGDGGTINGVGALFFGLINISGSGSNGDVRAQFARRGFTQEVGVFANSYMTLRRVG